jgi:lipopolysaccharide/colanic/teichoic acid biosynthesis glycosyltransferase
MKQDWVQPTSTSPLFGTQTSEQRQVYFACKRLFDILVTAILLLLLSPLMLVIALVIMLDSPGPAIFRQERVVLRRRVEGQRVRWEVSTFPFFKFRTMYKDADSSLHRAFIQAFVHNDQESMNSLQGKESQVLKLVHDPRVTRVGKFLRKSSLDELPQLANVLRGDMSLVGPRPAIPYEADLYEPWHWLRLEAKPGITGLWQVTARSSTDFDGMVLLDTQYIRRQSFWLDLEILLKTPLAVLRGKGAV